MPSNEGRGYVLRRIMRRGMRHANMLGAKSPLMWQMVPTLVAAMGEAFPEICRARVLIEQTLLLEEERFHQTLDRGLKLLRDATHTLAPAAPLPGDVAFRLYDTYGFPLDLTEDVLRAENRAVDRDGFAHHMDEQKKRARAAWSGSGDTAQEAIWLDLREKHGASEFLGYASTHAEGVIQAIVKDGAAVDSATAGDKVSILLNQTPFYAESGGQVGDKGTVHTANATLAITDCVKKAGMLFVHQATVMSGTITAGDAVKADVDVQRRKNIAANHSATHLLHAALRTVLGDHVSQKGSHVDDARLRFDFTHPKGMTAEELARVSAIVNAEIQKNTPTRVVVSTPDKAIADGAVALFGEKYGDEVRVVSMGESDAYFSVELCGGTHVKATGDIGLFKLMHESSVAAGVRRIEAITGAGVLDYLAVLESNVAELKEQTKKAQTEAFKQIEALQTKIVMAQCETAHTNTVPFGSTKAVFKALKDVSAKDLKTIAEHVRTKLGSGVVIIASENDGKVSLVIAVSADLTATISAVDLIRLGATHLGGKGGGGKPDLAQGGGDNSAALPTLLKALAESLK
jgi:alanyl-tRNA synthetase